jgi:hypothetical protein
LLQISHTKRLVAINVLGDSATTSASGSGVPGRFRFRFCPGPGGCPLETVVVVVAGVAAGSAVLPSSVVRVPDEPLASPADALQVMLDNVISPPAALPPAPNCCSSSLPLPNPYPFSPPAAPATATTTCSPPAPPPPPPRPLQQLAKYYGCRRSSSPRPCHLADF